MNENHLTEIDAAIAARTAKLQEDAELSTPHGRARRHWTMATRGIHPSRVAEVIALLAGGEDRIARLVAAGDHQEALREVDRVTDKIRYGGFTGAKREPEQWDVWRREIALFGYDPGILFNDQGGLVRPGQQITRMDWWTIAVDGKEFSHEELRRRAGLNGRPLPTRAEIERRAETDFEIRAILRRIDAR